MITEGIYQGVERLRSQTKAHTIAGNVMDKVSLSLATRLDAHTSRRFIRYQEKHDEYPKDLPHFYTTPEEIATRRQKNKNNATWEVGIGGGVLVPSFIVSILNPLVGTFLAAFGLGAVAMGMMHASLDFKLELIQEAQTAAENMRRTTALL